MTDVRLLDELRSPSGDAQLAALRPLTYTPWLDLRVEQSISDLRESAPGSVGEASQMATDRYERALARPGAPGAEAPGYGTQAA